MNPIVIIGASGFIGESLLNLYNLKSNADIHLLTRNIEIFKEFDNSTIKIIQGDLTNEKSLNGLIQHGAIVINLAFLEGSDKSTNLNAIKNLVNKCKSVGIKRLLHCSSSSVFGATKEQYITEETSCCPLTEYEVTKYEIEELLKQESSGCFELVIVRPTSVFGPKGKNLIKFIKSIENGNSILNYLRVCLYWKRRMNLVSVETVASAIKFLSESNKIFKQEIFIISQDDDERNNYYDIEKYVRKFMYVGKYVIPVLPIPPIVLKSLLWVRRRSNIEINTIYSNNKLYETGFESPTSLIDSLQKFIDSL